MVGAVPLAVQCGVVRAEGGFYRVGSALVPSDGGAWRLPAFDGEGEGEGGATLADLGYRARVGYLVPHRGADRLHEHRRTARNCWPLVWAKAVASDGSFDFRRALEHTEAQRRIWVDAPADAPYVVKRPLVVVQRTSNRKQVRRINAAAVPQSFIDEHGGLVGENHVLLVAPASEAEPPVNVDDLAALLNSGPVNERFNRVCGTVTISAQLIRASICPRRGGLSACPDWLRRRSTKLSEPPMASWSTEGGLTQPEPPFARPGGPHCQSACGNRALSQFPCCRGRCLWRRGDRGAPGTADCPAQARLVRHLIKVRPQAARPVGT